MFITSFPFTQLRLWDAVLRKGVEVVLTTMNRQVIVLGVSVEDNLPVCWSCLHLGICVIINCIYRLVVFVDVFFFLLYVIVNFMTL